MPTPLLESEKLLMRVHRHWALLLFWSLGPVLVILLTLVANITWDGWVGLYAQRVAVPSGLRDPRTSPALPSVRVALTLLLLAISGFWLIVQWLRWSTLTVSVTTFRFIKDVDGVAHVSHTIGLDRVLDVSSFQSPMGQLFGYGTLRVNNLDLGLDFIPDSDKFAQEIYVRARAKGAADAATVPGKDELLQETAQAEAEAQAQARHHEPGHRQEGGQGHGGDDGGGRHP
jgi:hypothetical protein